MTRSPLQIAVTCRSIAPGILGLPIGVNAAQLMWAISGVETSFGRNIVPRHEPAYDVGGHYATSGRMPDLLALYGRAAACSYGVWQVMLVNAPLGYKPTDFDNLIADGLAARHVLNEALRRFTPKNLIEIGEIWNAGHITPDESYTDKLETNYRIPMPTG